MSASKLLQRAARRLAYARLRLALRGEQARFALILGHMRSGSTLLLHLLLSHPAILGCGERNATYRSRRDLARLALDSRYYHKSFSGRVEYYVDQINHDRFVDSTQLLDEPSVRRLFILRQPAASLASLVRTAARYRRPWSIEDAVQYYVDRTSTLEQYAAGVRCPLMSLCVQYERLTGQSGRELERLRTFLGLSTPLSDRYPIFPFTGRGRGDPSEKIRAGRILRPSQPQPLDIPASLLARAADAHSSCLRVLSARSCGEAPRRSTEAQVARTDDQTDGR